MSKAPRQSGRTLDSQWRVVISNSSDNITVEHFIQDDMANLGRWKNNLMALDAEAVATVEHCSRTLTLLSDSFGRLADLGDKNRCLENWAKQNNISISQSRELLLSATFIGNLAEDSATDARSELYDASGVVVRSMLLVRVRRDYLFGLVDVVKNRATWGLGSLRTQLETLAIQRLICDSPNVGLEWLGADLGESGKKFHNKYHSKLVDYIKSWGLKNFHDMGSTTAMHSRPSGISGAIGTDGGPQIVQGGIEISMSTIDAPEASEFHLYLCYFLRFYDRVLFAIDQIVPEVSDHTELVDRIQKFSSMVEQRWKSLDTKYPELKERIRRFRDD